MSESVPSRYLRPHQIAALVQIGDCCVPGERSESGERFGSGEREVPSFRELGCVRHVDRVLEHVAEADRASLGLLLSILWACPAPLHRRLLRWAAGSFEARGPLAPLLREVDYGLRGLVLTLYFSEWTKA